MIKKYKACVDGIAGVQHFYFDTVEDLKAGIQNLKTVFHYAGGFDTKRTRVRIFDGFNYDHILEKKRYESYPALYRKLAAYECKAA